MRLRPAIAVVSLLGSLVPAPGAAGADQPAPVMLSALLAPAGVSSQRGAPDALDGLGLLDPASGPVDLADGQRALLERAWGVRIPDWKAAVAERAAEDAGEQSGPDGRYRVPIASSDVDGDGHQDALLFDIGLAPNAQWTDVSLTAHDGVGGRRLWSRDFGLPYDALVFSPGDVTGDSADDLLIVVIRRTFEPEDIVCEPPQFCSFKDTTHYTWEISLASGADGSTVWDRTISGTSVITGAYAGQGPSQHVYHNLEAENALFEMRPAGDVDGDGLGDFTLNLFDFRGHRVFRLWVWTEVLRYDTKAEVLAGDTGTPILTRTADDQPGAALLLPAADATGDGRADLLWSAPARTSLPRCTAGGCPADPSPVTLRLELVDGATDLTRWQSEVAEPLLRDAVPVLTERDLTGDGRADVLVGIERSDGTQAGTLVSGLDGSRGWTFDALLTDPPSALGSIDGGPGSDVLFWEGWYPTEEEAPGAVFRIRLRRVDGATGTHLFTTQHDLGDPDERYDTIFAYPGGDANADGVPDIAHALWRYDGFSEPDGTASTVLRIESGADGSDLLRLVRDRKALLFDGGDFVPGGPEDLLEGSATYNDTDFRLSAIAMPGGDTLWSQTDVLYTAAYGTLRRPAGQGDDVLYARTRAIAEAPKLLSRIDVLRGASGAQAWGLGPQL